MSAIQNQATSFKNKLFLKAANVLNDRLPLKAWHRSLSFAIQAILYAYAIPGLFGTLMMGHLDYTPDELGGILQNLVHLIVFAMLLNLALPSRRSFLAYLGYSALANLALIVAAFTYMATFT
ncbi:hypothetical protein [Rhizobium sp. MHM7A]|uniref:hypothetical protein n=1 Tax=Rhizobium sp. MHM7A TaxID=2583233 RepID=UPI00110606D2|nr:hypothetical protein [Rhizobium sp. MHM7A]TLX16002.1 hypothetical protein FFR93_01405 [Rhizobium sp. MHM7A]